MHEFITSFNLGWQCNYKPQRTFWSMPQHSAFWRWTFHRILQTSLIQQIMSPVLLFSSRPLLTALTTAALLKHDITVCWLTALPPLIPRSGIVHCFLDIFIILNTFFLNMSWSRQLMCIQDISFKWSALIWLPQETKHFPLINYVYI